MSFRTLNIKTKYKSQYDNYIESFYVPVLSSSVKYDRVSAYFTIPIMKEYIEGIKEVVLRNGKLRFIISPIINEKDIEVFISSLNVYSYVKENLSKLFIELETGDEKDHIFKDIFILLIQNKILEFKVAVTKNKLGIFHEKFGIFYDDFSNVIAISGSNNETISAVFNNSESFNTFCSWKVGQEEYVKDHIEDFEEYWNENNINNTMYSLEEILDNDLFVSNYSLEEIDILYDKLDKYKNYSKIKRMSLENLKFEPYDYQREAVEKWFEVYKGIFKFATGSGKTKTAIYLMAEFMKRENTGFFIVVVPDKTLVNQWENELRENGIEAIKCYSDNPKWREQSKEVVDFFIFKKNKYGVLLVTKNLFFSDIFELYTRKLKDYVLIVDECHNLGTENYLNKLPITKYKLGLSATPEVYFSEERTMRLFDYFGGVIAEYSIEDAIRDNKLVGYSYYPIFVELSSKEKEKYRKLTLDLIKIIGNEDEKKAFSNEDAKLILFQRAKIIYGAISKMSKLKEIVFEISSKGKLIIYCGATSYTDLDNEVQINEIIYEESVRQIELVNSILSDLNIDAAQYTESETGEERIINIDQFKKGTFSTLVAIKCLDEGVNIEEIERAIILASTNNPREFVQRRGRLLRRANNKEKAEIYDFIVFDDDPFYYSMSTKEISRMYEFSKISLNKNELMSQYDQLFNEYVRLEE